MPIRKIRLPNRRGELLSARLDLPDRKPKAYALFAHCFTCGKDLWPVRVISRVLNRQGIALLRFDFTGIGESEGDFADTNFSSQVEDLQAAIDYMQQENIAPKLMMGHSLGGTATLVAAAQAESCRAVAVIGSPCTTTNVLKHFVEHIEVIEEEGRAEVLLAGRPFTIKKQFLEDARAHNVKESIANLGKPLLICHSPFDETVAIDHASDIFMMAKHPKSFISLNEADHLLMTPGAAAYAGSVIASWAHPFLHRAEA